MRTTNLILAIAALAGVAFLYVRDDAGGSSDEALHDLGDRVAAVDLRVEQLSKDVARLVKQREEEGPRLLGAAPEDRQLIADLRASTEAAQAELSKRVDQLGERLRVAQAPLERKGPKKGPPDAAKVDRWIERLEHEDEDIVFSATIELARLGDARATDPLIRVLQKHKDFYARLGAATAIGELRAARAVSALIEALNDRDDLVRTATAEALHLITKQDFNFVSGLKKEERLLIQEKWRAWWRDHEDEVVERLREKK